MIGRVGFCPKHILLLDSDSIITTLISKLAKGTIFLATLWTLPASANSLNFEQLYIFGDSLSDSGNFYNLSGSTFPPSPFYSQGRFTNGLTWIDYLSDDLGLNPEPFTELDGDSLPPDGINFAFGGARTDDINLGGEPFPGLEQQLDFFTDLLEDGETANPDALYVVWAGGNDYLGESMNEPTETVDNLSSALTTLAEAGARDILVGNLPDLGATPIAQSLGNEAVAFLNNLTSEHNTLLEQSIDELNQSSDTNFILFDTNTLFKDFIASVEPSNNNDDDDEPGAFGFTNVTDNCTSLNFPSISIPPIEEDLENLSSCIDNDPDTFLWWDNQHPTDAAHESIAESAFEVLSSEFDDDDDDDIGNNEVEIFPPSEPGVETPATSVPELTSIWSLFAIVLPSIGSWLLGKKQK